MEIQHEKTQAILKAFDGICGVPRPSKHEEKILAHLIRWAKDHGLDHEQDEAGNTVVSLPASAGYENSEGVIIQAHVDMVCEKTPDSNHDFSQDPIKLIDRGEWLTADRTTLGADNGIAVAMAMALAEDPSIAHPPIELLFTVDEETGLNGAKELRPGWLRGKRLINLDTEDEGVFTIGCAGGVDTTLIVPIETAEVPPGARVYSIKLSGMKGGHSGVDIHLGRANAIAVLARLLASIPESCDLRLMDIHGGTARNAIPRDAEASILIAHGKESSIVSRLTDIAGTIQSEFAKTDPNLAMQWSEIPASVKALTAESTRRMIDLLRSIPHGVIAMSAEIEGLVETSTNLANVALRKTALEIGSSQRGSVMSRLEEIATRMESIARLSGGEARRGGGYPAWQPRLDSPLLEQCREVYRRLFSKEPVVEIIHAGLECGIIGGVYPQLDMISFGPTIRDPHSPDERVHVGSIAKVWDFLTALLKDLK